MVVVDQLEAVDITHDEGDVLASSDSALEDFGQTFVEYSPVAEAGQGVAPRQGFELGEAFGLGDGCGDVAGDQPKRRQVRVIEWLTSGVCFGGDNSPPCIADHNGRYNLGAQAATVERHDDLVVCSSVIDRASETVALPHAVESGTRGLVVELIEPVVPSHAGVDECFDAPSLLLEAADGHRGGTECPPGLVGDDEKHVFHPACGANRSTDGAQCLHGGIGFGRNETVQASEDVAQCHVARERLSRFEFGKDAGAEVGIETEPRSSSTRRRRVVQFGVCPGLGWPTRVAAMASSRAASGVSGPRRPCGPPEPSHRSN